MAPPSKAKAEPIQAGACAVTPEVVYSGIGGPARAIVSAADVAAGRARLDRPAFIVVAVDKADLYQAEARITNVLDAP